jgi:hypothetical protein
MIGKKSLVCLGVGVAVLCLISVARADGGPEVSLSIDSFEECVARSGKVLKMYPPKCVTKDGKVFAQTVRQPSKTCKNMCGDGECQEIVCMAIGCPCAENRATCPNDCSE